MGEKFVKSLRGKVFYWISDKWDKKKQTVFFLHGLTADHTMFEMQVEYFSEKYNVIVWDAPAHGKSRPYTEFSYANAVEELDNILVENAIDKVILVGQSLGGYFSQSFIRSYPQKVTAFVGIDTTPYGEIYYSKLDKWLLRQVEWMAHLYPYEMMKRAIAKQVSVTDYGYINMLSMLGQYSKNELCHLMGIGYAAFLDDNTDMNIECPVLILLGENDKTGKVQQYNKAWAKKTRYPLIIIKNAAHNANVDNPMEVNNAIEAFLERL